MYNFVGPPNLDSFSYRRNFLFHLHMCSVFSMSPALYHQDTCTNQPRPAHSPILFGAYDPQLDKLKYPTFPQRARHRGGIGSAGKS